MKVVLKKDKGKNGTSVGTNMGAIRRQQALAQLDAAIGPLTALHAEMNTINVENKPLRNNTFSGFRDRLRDNLELVKQAQGILNKTVPI